MRKKEMPDSIRQYRFHVRAQRFMIGMMLTILALTFLFVLVYGAIK